jgi:ferrous iron transport protein A
MPPSSPQTFPLAELKTGEHAFLQAIHAERAVVSRLTSLGFTPGVEIQMTQNFGHGPLLVLVRGTRIALGRQEARGTTVLRGEA